MPFFAPRMPLALRLASRTVKALKARTPAVFRRLAQPPSHRARRAVRSMHFQRPTSARSCAAASLSRATSCRSRYTTCFVGTSKGCESPHPKPAILSRLVVSHSWSVRLGSGDGGSGDLAHFLDCIFGMFKTIKRKLRWRYIINPRTRRVTGSLRGRWGFHLVAILPIS